MSIRKKFLFAAGAAVLLAVSAVSADIEIKPYGTAHYRLREQINTGTNPDGDGSSFGIYSNWFAWRAGARVKANDQLSLQFQIGNDWGYAEQVNWINNNYAAGDPGTAGFTAIRPLIQNLYVHVASFKWDAGPLYVEAGVVNVPAGNGALDLLERSLFTNSYESAAFLGWGITNASLLGVRVGVPIVKDGDVKVRAELLQTVVETRASALNYVADAASNPSSPLFVFNLPVDFAALNLKITPEFIGIVNRHYNLATEEGDHEFIGGLGANYKVNDGITVTANGAYGQVSNGNSNISTYNNGAAAGAYTSNGLQVGAGATVKAGPGSIFFDFKYSSAVNSESSVTEDATKKDFIHALLQYGLKPNPNVSIIPRYRLFYTANPEGSATETAINHRFELILEGSF